MAEDKRLDRAIAALAQAPDLDQARQASQLPIERAGLLAGILEWTERTILERWLHLVDEQNNVRARLRIGNRRLYQLDGTVRSGMMASANEGLAKGSGDDANEDSRLIADWLEAATSGAKSLRVSIETNTDGAPHAIGLPTAALAAAWGQARPDATTYDGPQDPLGELLALDLVQRQLWVHFDGDEMVQKSDRRGADDLVAMAPLVRQVLMASSRAPGLCTATVDQAEGTAALVAFTKNAHVILVVANTDLGALLAGWQNIMESA